MEFLLPGVTNASNLHPMVVHFPIAFWIAATAAWSFALLRRNSDAWRFGLWLHTLGAMGAVVAVAFGFAATAKMGHEAPGHALVHVHRDIMLVATILSVLLTSFAWWRHTRPHGWKALFLVVSLLLTGTMTIGADRGGELVFRYGVGVSQEIPPSSGHGHGDGGSDHEH